MELAAGYLFAWLVRRGKNVAERAGTEADHALDLAQESLHDAVARKLGRRSALAAAEAEASAGHTALSSDTGRELTATLVAAAAQDQEFGALLSRALERIAELEGARAQPAPAPAGSSGSSFHFGNATFNGSVQMGNHNTQTNYSGTEPPR